MKTINRLWPGFVLLLGMVSCVDYTRPEFEVVKPESIAQMEYLDSYDVLKSYIDRDANPGFKLGSGVSVGQFNERGLMYGLISSNFDEVSAGYAMKHGAVVQADGSLNLSNVIDFINAAEEAGMTIYGHTLCWHANQNANYLNNTIAPVVIPGTGEPALEEVFSDDFESGTGTWTGWGNSSTRALSADGEGYGGTGYAYTFTNPSVTDYWGAQVSRGFSNPLIQGSTYNLRFKVKGSVAGDIRVEVQSSSDYSSDGFGVFSITEDWQEYILETTATAEDRDRLIYSFGDYVGTVSIDSVVFSRWNPDGGGQVIEKPAAEKKEIISAELERWISGMMDVAADYVSAWDVVNEPMDDGSPYNLKTGVGRTLNNDEFFWQDYLGKDYAVMAFNLARKYGKEGDLLFINDYNLEYSIDKCKGLIAYAEYIESKGEKIDGIGTQMHISTSSDKNKIAEMFTLLAATGKLIKVSELDIGIGGGVKTADATEEHYIAQAEMYKYVVEKYLELIPAAQRYGITVWSPLDSPANSSWRKGEPIGLWTLQYNRKRAYGGFADGLMME